MRLYKFYNPFASKGDECAIIRAATDVEALFSYLRKFFPNCGGIYLSKDFSMNGAIVMFKAYDFDDMGGVVFSRLYAIKLT